MAVNPMNNKNLSRTHSKELAKNNRGKRTRKNSDYKTTATAARQAQSQAPQKAAWPTKVKVTPLLNNLTTLLLGISCGALYFIRKDYPAPKASKLDGVVNAVLIVFALFYGVMGVWGLIRMVG